VTTPKAKPTPGPKPDYLVVEDHLKCQTNEGEISIDLRIPLERIELFMDIGETVEQKKIPRYMLDNIIWPEDKAVLEGMRDGAKVFEILIKFSEYLGGRMGADMGEFKGSTGPSEDTVEPSATTSETASE
jgi:hypothetical protein